MKQVLDELKSHFIPKSLYLSAKFNELVHIAIFQYVYFQRLKKIYKRPFAKDRKNNG